MYVHTYCVFTGEVAQSYGYGASGQSSTAGMFNSYGESFGPGDIVGCFVVSYSSNVNAQE